jgi:hypothetical protein
VKSEVATIKKLLNHLFALFLLPLLLLPAGCSPFISGTVIDIHRITSQADVESAFGIPMNDMGESAYRWKFESKDRLLSLYVEINYGNIDDYTVRYDNVKDENGLGDAAAIIMEQNPDETTLLVQRNRDLIRINLRPDMSNPSPYTAGQVESCLIALGKTCYDKLGQAYPNRGKSSTPRDILTAAAMKRCFGKPFKLTTDSKGKLVYAAEDESVCVSFHIQGSNPVAYERDNPADSVEKIGGMGDGSELLTTGGQITLVVQRGGDLAVITLVKPKAPLAAAMKEALIALGSAVCANMDRWLN